jgi:ABC-type dipeptide/oligopeptide/nickel transport system ATPase subunit
MPIDFNAHEVKLLLRQFERGSVVLFAGAGFSLGARNSRGVDPPLGQRLAETLASECGWRYDGEELGTVYEQAQKHLGTERMNAVLREMYGDCTPAPWHYLVAGLLWYRIYTTNIDDVLENSYARGPAQRLRAICCPADFEAQDMWYENVHLVHLHGSVLDLGKGLTFTPAEYAGQTAVPNPWYQALADDMFSSSVVFVGTRLNEPPMYHYLAMRSERSKGVQEVRPKAFVVTPTMSPIRRRQLSDQGYYVIEASAEEFFRGIQDAVRDALPNRLALLKNRYPHQIAAINAGLLETQAELLRSFELLSPGGFPVRNRVPGHEIFFEGAEPTWDDIANGLDAPRDAATGFLQAMAGTDRGLRCFALVGHAGSGKSTLLRRMAFSLAQDGHSVYFCRAAQMVDGRAISNFLDSLEGRHVYMFIDDAIMHLRTLNEVAQRLREGSNVTFVLADRPHVLYARLRELHSMRPAVLEMPQLEKADCERIIGRLESFGMLGELRGKSRKEQLMQFLGRSKKQLLVAMKEATSGRGFDVILENEFKSLSGENAKIAYTVACLAYMHGAPVRRRHLLACMSGTDIEKAEVLSSDLREVIIPWNQSEDLLAPRHRVIAKQVATESSPVGTREVAVGLYLSQLSADVTPLNITRRTPEYLAYRGIINFDNMLDLFGEDYETIAGIYGELREFYGHDFLFWLQSGRAEVYFDRFTTAENHLKQSLAIRDVGNFQAHHQLGVLFLKRARLNDNPASAEADLKQGEDLLREQIAQRGDTDSYPYAALVTHKFRYLRDRGSPRLAEEVEGLVNLAQAGMRKHPLDEAMREAYEEIMRAYLMLAVRAKGGTSAGGA